MHKYHYKAAATGFWFSWHPSMSRMIENFAVMNDIKLRIQLNGNLENTPKAALNCIELAKA